MLGVVEDLVERPALDDPPGVHDQHPVGDLGDDAEVVGDQDRRQAAFAVEAREQGEDLRLDVTSSAVVGSSAISTSGSSASAIAIIARWRIPPENSCG